MAWGDIKDPFGYEKFQVRSGNEPSAAQFAKDTSQSWMDAGYPFPSVTPYWQRGFTTEAPGVSPGAGNTRTYQWPGQWGQSTAPEYGGAYQDPESEMGLKGFGSTGLRGIENLIANQFRNPEQEESGYEKFQTRSGNEPEAFALQNQVAQEFMEGGYPYPSVTPYLQRGFTGEYPGISPGAGNTRTYQSPDKFSFSVTPNPNQTMPSFNELMEIFNERNMPMQDSPYSGVVNQYIGQTGGPAGMGMPAYMDRPETQDRRPIYRDVSELGQTMGPAGMGMPAYMDRPGPDAYPEEEFPYPRGRYGDIDRLLKNLSVYLAPNFNEGGAVGLEPGIGSLMGRI